MATNRPGFFRRSLELFWRAGNFRKDHFLTSDEAFIPQTDTLRTQAGMHLVDCRGAESCILALPEKAQAIIVEESRRAEAHYLLRPGFPISIKLLIGILFGLCFAFPVAIAFRQSQWSFALGSITSAPRSAGLIILYLRYANSGLELDLSFFENRLWINMPPGIIFAAAESSAVAAVRREIWFLAIAAIFSAALLLTGVLMRSWLWRRKLQHLKRLQIDLSDSQKAALRQYSLLLDGDARELLSSKEERRSDDPRGYQNGASIPTSEMIDIGVLHSRRMRQVIAIFVPATETAVLYPARDKYKFYSVIIVAFILTVGLNYDQFMVIIDAIGKYIWTWIKIRRGVRNPDISPESLARTVSIIFIETIPSLILIGLLLRASGGTILDTWEARMAIGIVLGITKTFLSDHVLEFFFWVGVNLAQLWQLLGLGPLMRRIKMRLDQVAGLLGFPLLKDFFLPYLAPVFHWLSKGVSTILG
ncbi:hypothetical protein RHIZ_22215 [Rhizobium skierniewicense]|uniref:hypothetical protein n=1 Tax=Rhizobium TaxID=379 RepID=UPI00177FFD5D|nr:MULTISPECIES: hypothetical protein [Rhizobium]MBD8689938.1 hypothetical protein [Rhizobium sp. CFBP 13644]MBD8694531.1 hypothetical protein [Rhizobium sp. CFBP 13717]MCI9868677.1 hypothetical protein [Rhizobium skierniewicense]